MKALGLLGGTFNPVHVGHIRGAIEARERLALDQVLLIPANLPPLKAAPGVDARHRLRMLELAVADEPGLAVDSRELDREGVSYTVQTLQALRNAYGEAVSLTFIIGADCLTTLDQWYHWQQLTKLANIAVIDRPDSGGVIPVQVAAWLEDNACQPSDLARRPCGGVVRLGQSPLAISSTELRAAIASGKNVRFLLPDPVIEYISDHDLYSS